MIEYIRGVVAEATPAYIVLETPAQIGYMLMVSVNTFEAVSNDKGTVRLLVHEVIREDAQILYGFSTDKERELFRLLIGVSGVGPGTAMLILSSITPADLEAAIVSGNSDRLKTVKGIGGKTAQRIIVDLKDKIKTSEFTLSSQQGMSAPSANPVYEEALAALTALGFQKAQSQKVLARIFDAEPDVKIESAVKKALSMM